MKFKHYRFFINKTSQIPLFSDPRSSIEILIEIMNDDLVKDFTYRKSELGFVILDRIGSYLYCKFGKRSQISRTLSPQEKFEKESEVTWPNCNVFINTSSNNSNGQLILIESKVSVFKDPINALRGLADKINEKFQRYGYDLSINPISSKTGFWNIVDKYDGSLEEVIFHYNAPNLFNLDDKLNDDLRKAKREYNATETTIALKNPDSKLNVIHTPLVDQSVEYITKGGGEYKLKVGRKWFSSNDTVKTSSIDVDLTSSDKEVILDVFNRIMDDVKND